jgi:hypothetical protein
MRRGASFRSALWLPDVARGSSRVAVRHQT